MVKIRNYSFDYYDIQSELLNIDFELEWIDFGKGGFHNCHSRLRMLWIEHGCYWLDFVVVTVAKVWVFTMVPRVMNITQLLTGTCGGLTGVNEFELTIRSRDRCRWWIGLAGWLFTRKIFEGAWFDFGETLNVFNQTFFINKVWFFFPMVICSEFRMGQ